MAQDPIAPVDPNTVGGVELAAELEDWEQTLLSQHSGSSRPTYAIAGTLWLDTTTTPWLWKLYDGTSDIVVAAFSASSHLMREGVSEASLSGATPNVLGSASKFLVITGSTTITSLGSEPNVIKFVRFSGSPAPLITHNATTLICPTGANIQAEQGDTFIVISDASGNARIYAYQKADGEALTVPAVAAAFATGTILLFFGNGGSAPTGWTKDTTNFNDHAIRIVTGVPSNGGSLNFSTVFGYTATLNYTLTSADIPAHTHGSGSYQADSSGSHNHDTNNTWDAEQRARGTGSNTSLPEAGGKMSTTSSTDGSHTHNVSGTSSSTGGGGGHAHSMDMRVRYVDAFRATKD
jgi:hypothetical protein